MAPKEKRTPWGAAVLEQLLHVARAAPEGATSGA